MSAIVFALLSFALHLRAAPVVFNRDVRPVLSDRCFACHGPDAANRKTKLRLDIEDGAKTDLGAGRRGIVPGDPSRSEVYQRLVSTNQTRRMPPAYLGHERLSDAEIATIRAWIEQGASYQPHWSLLAPVKAPRPETRQRDWPRNEIDSFILSRLEREDLAPSPPADARTLIRRVTLDLTGLPPTPEESDRFAQDPSPAAYTSLVDRLLISPRYAERMAIRWLEAARYADTNGYQSDGPRQMWRWRDWVIDAFQRNMPFDRFTIEQIAGDLLPDAGMQQKIATGFHRNHRTSAEGGIVDEEFRVEYVADRVETTATVWMGLTAGCARCHDHKFDPITQKDYYSLFAFFNNIDEKGFVWNFGNEPPVIQAPLPEQQRQLDEFDRRIEEAEGKLAGMQDDLARAQAKWEQRVVTSGKPVECDLMSGLAMRLPLDTDASLPSAPGKIATALRFDGKRYLDAGDGPKFNYRDPFTFAAWVQPESADGAILSRGEDYFEGQQHALYLIGGKLRLHVTFRWTDLAMRLETERPLEMGRWQHVAVSYDGGMKAAGVRLYIDGKPQPVRVLFDQLLWPIDTKEPWRIGAGGGMRFTGLIDDARIYTRALSEEEAAVAANTDRVDRLAALDSGERSKAQADKLRLCFLEEFAPRNVRRTRKQLAVLRSARAAFAETIPTVMVMREREERRPTYVLKRGAYDAPGERVEPATPRALPQLRPEWPRNRLGLARWLVDRSNPLTARAVVNRYWAMLFGVGLVKTVEDLGSQGEWPSHPELLDWLAVEFMESGWDVKHILKTMVMSAAYRQSSRVTPDLLRRDPENRLLARGPRFRLPAEMIRDQALAVSGLLAERVGGPPVRPYQPSGLWQELQGGKGYVEDEGEGLYRRSLYSFWKRIVAPPNMINFDAPARETCVVRETRANTPLQALNLMNDVAYLEAARKLGERMQQAKGTEARIAAGFRLALGREPGAGESAAIQEALAKFQAYYRMHPADANRFLSQGKAPRGRGNAATLASYAAVAGILLNLDETVTKE